MSAVHEPPVRPEYVAPQRAAPAPALVSTGSVDRLSWLNKPAILLALVILWELLARWVDNDLLLPGALQTARAFIDGIASGELIGYVTVSLAILVQGFLLGVAIAFLLTWLALALLWFGLGKGSLLMVLVHSVVWPLTLNASAGFRAVPETLRMAGRNYGLGGLRMVLQILVPAALPSILSGLKIGWAFAWRTLIAAELVFGSTSGQGGLGWYIFQNRNELFTDKVFAGLATVILIGLAIERCVFQTLERVTVRRWGMQR
jgi:NitT/TauT family transport system permease protein